MSDARNGLITERASQHFSLFRSTWTPTRYWQVQRHGRRHVKQLLKQLVDRLEHKWATCPRGIAGDIPDWDWNYKNAAQHFHAVTGCSLSSAKRFFWLVEDAAEDRWIAGGEPTRHDRVTWMGNRIVALPK